jgi:hypothetical protein
MEAREALLATRFAKMEAVIKQFEQARNHSQY